MLRGMISPDWEEMGRRERLYNRARLHRLEATATTPTTSKVKDRQHPTINEEEETPSDHDITDVGFKGGSLKTALVIDSQAAIDRYCAILGEGLCLGGNVATNLLYGQVDLVPSSSLIGVYDIRAPGLQAVEYQSSLIAYLTQNAATSRGAAASLNNSSSCTAPLPPSLSLVTMGSSFFRSVAFGLMRIPNMLSLPPRSSLCRS